MFIPFGDQPKIGPFPRLGSSCGTSLMLAPVRGETTSRANPVRRAGPPVQATRLPVGDQGVAVALLEWTQVAARRRGAPDRGPVAFEGHLFAFRGEAGVGVVDL